jgi:molybdate transport system ATP-binding protein
VSLAFSAQLAARGFDVNLEVGTGETVALMGPNGAGKSTLLGILAGTIRPDAGHATLGEHTLFDLGSDQRSTWLPPHARGVALLAQEPLLFPHLSVLENVAFGPRSAGAGRAAARELAARWLSEMEVGEFGAVRATKLSSGQSQRVAIARALAADPHLLLLDEPLAALDVGVTPTIRRMLRRVLAQRTVVMVTHEVLDALTLADTVVVMNNGAIVEHGETREVLERPRQAFTAELAGLNLVTGTSTSAGIRTAAGAQLIGDSSLPVGTDAAAAIRPAAITVLTQRPAGPNVLAVTVRDLEPRGDAIRLRTGSLFADLAPGRVAALDLHEGSEVFFSVDPAEIEIYAR